MKREENYSNECVQPLALEEQHSSLGVYVPIQYTKPLTNKLHCSLWMDRRIWESSHIWVSKFKHESKVIPWKCHFKYFTKKMKQAKFMMSKFKDEFKFQKAVTKVFWFLNYIKSIRSLSKRLDIKLLPILWTQWRKAKISLKLPRRMVTSHFWASRWRWSYTASRLGWEAQFLWLRGQCFLQLNTSERSNFSSNLNSLDWCQHNHLVEVFNWYMDLASGLLQ